MSHENQNPKLPHRDYITSFQINSLLNVAGVLANAVFNPMRGDENIPKENRLDGGVKNSVETTLINVCNCLDEIIQNPDRWSFKMQEHLEYKLGELYQREISLREAQIRATNEVNTPHFIYKPLLVKLKDGNYAAILGDINRLDDALVGVGSTPADAMKSFDEVFQGVPSDALIEWLSKQPPLSTPAKPRKRKKKNDTDSTSSN